MLYTMLILFHVLLAVSSIASTTYALLWPSSKKLRVSQALVAGTLVTGTYLTLSNPLHILQTCITGLFYTVGVCVGLWIASKRIRVHTS